MERLSADFGDREDGRDCSSLPVYSMKSKDPFVHFVAPRNLISHGAA
jgi:hypothetical protein